MTPSTFRRIGLALLGGAVGGIFLLFGADVWYLIQQRATFADQLAAGAAQEAGVWESIGMSLGTATVATLLSLLFGVPAAYALARGWVKKGKWIETILDLPVVIPPLLVGISLLVGFSLPPVRQAFTWLEDRWGLHLNPVYTISGIILAQLVIAGSLGVRVLQTTFERVPVKLELAARTLGASPWQAFRRITIPMAWKGVIASGIIIWTRSMAEFAPILILYGSHRPNVLPVTAFLELSTGRVEMAIAITLLIVGLSALALMAVRWLGTDHVTW